jgi:hypothetical protein
MKKNNELYLLKSKSNEEISKKLNEENEENKITENDNNSKDEIMCFCCRNTIKLNVFQQSYGKTGLLIKDFFYISSIKSTIRKEIPLIIENKEINSDILYDNIRNNWKNNNEDKLSRIISCGHFFHASCFTENCKKLLFTCPLCLKDQNILIPPLNNFNNKYDFLKSEKIKELFDENKEIKEFKINNESILFKKIIFDFLKNIYLLKEDEINEYSIFLDNIFINYKGYLSFLENVFYIDGTTFHKQQQIDTMQNIILSMRYLVKNNYIKQKQIINYIRNVLSDLLIGLNINEENILGKFENMYYINLLEKIILSLSILFDYDELKETFKYIIYIFLPYISFGFYLRYLIINKYSFNEINIDNFKNYIISNNQQMIIYFHKFIQKLSFTKLLIDFSDKNDELINTFKNLTIENILSILNVDNLYRFIKLENKEINFVDILEYLPKTFNSNDIFYKEFNNNFDYNKIFNILFANIQKNQIKGSITKELIIHFCPIKFDFIHLDNNLFDWVEKNLEKKCIMCSKTSKYDYICLICGNKICHTKSCNKYIEHIRNCCGKSGIVIDMDNMKIKLVLSIGKLYSSFPLYVNENGVGPNEYEMGNEFYLSSEKLKLAIKNYSCNDIHFN